MPKTGDDADELYQQIIDSGKNSGIIEELEEEAPAKTHENYSYSGFRMDPVTGDLIVSFRDYTNPITSEDDESTTYDEAEIRFNSGKDVGQYKEFAARFEQFAKMDESYAIAQSMYGNMPTESEFGSFLDNVLKLNIAEYSFDKSIYNADGEITEAENTQMESARKSRDQLYTGLGQFFDYGRSIADQRSALQKATGNADYYFGGISVDPTSGEVVVGFVDTTKPIYATDENNEFLLDENNNKIIAGYEKADAEKRFDIGKEGGIAEFQTFIKDIEDFGLADSRMAIARNKAEGNTDESKPVVGDSLSGYITDLTNAFQTGSGYYALQSAREAVTGDAGLYLNGYTVDTETGDLIIGITDRSAENTIYDDDGKISGYKDKALYNLDGELSSDESEALGSINSYYTDTLSGMTSYFGVGTNAAGAKNARIAVTGDENLYLNGYTVDTTTGELVVGLTDKSKPIYGKDEAGNEIIVGYENTKTKSYGPTQNAEFESFLHDVFRLNVAQNALDMAIFNLDGEIDDEEDKQLKNANKDRMDLYSGLDSYYYYGQALYNRNEDLL